MEESDPSSAVAVVVLQETPAKGSRKQRPARTRSTGDTIRGAGSLTAAAISPLLVIALTGVAQCYGPAEPRASGSSKGASARRAHAIPAEASWTTTTSRSRPSTTHSPASGPLVTADAPWPKCVAKAWARFGAFTTSRTAAQTLSTPLVRRCQRGPHTVTPTAPRMARTATRTRGWTPRLAWAASWIRVRQAALTDGAPPVARERPL